MKWDHFVNVYNLDKLNPGNLKVCPKLFASHLVLNSSVKMRVRLAVQVALLFFILFLYTFIVLINNDYFML